MEKKTLVSIGIILLLIIAGGMYAYTRSADMESRAEQNQVTATSPIEEEMPEDTAEIMEADASGSYEAYTTDKLARAETGDVVLFFSASWCPSCRGLNADIEKNRDTIPEGVTILKVDYDKELELRKKYEVTYQHTLVQVDANGMLITKWSGSPTLSALLSRIN